MFNFNKQFAAVIGAARVVRQAARSWVARGLTLALLVSFSLLVGTSSFSEGATSPAQLGPAPDVTLSVPSKVLVGEATSPALQSPLPVAYFDQTLIPPDVPSEVLIGEEFTFKVRFRNGQGGATGFGPFIDLAINSRGADNNTGAGPCDGVEFVHAEMVAVNGGPLATSSQVTPSPCITDPSEVPVPHPYGNGPGLPGPVTLPANGWQLVTVELPFGSFDSSQPEIVVEVTAKVHPFADVDVPLQICTRGGFHFGASATVGTSITEHGNNVVADHWMCETVTPMVFTLKKEYLGPEGPGNWEAVAGPNFIQYYPLKYQITANIADGQTIHKLQITDGLPGNVQFVGHVSVMIFGDEADPVGCGPPSSGFPVDIAMPSTSTPGGTLTVTLCESIDGKAMADDVVITFEFYIPEKVLDEKCDSSPMLVKNDVIATGEWDPLDPRDPDPNDPPGTTVPIISNVTHEDHILQAKCLAIQKSVRVAHDTGEPGPTPGDTLQYTLTFQISDYHTIGYIVITDRLADGQEFIPDDPAPMLTIQDQFDSYIVETITPVVDHDFDAKCSPGGPLPDPNGITRLEFDVSGALAAAAGPPRHLAGILTGGFATDSPSYTPAFGQLVFYAKITDEFAKLQSPGDKYVDKHDPINNCVDIKGTVFMNEPADTVPTQEIGGAQDGDDAQNGSASQVTIVTGILKKTVYAIKRGGAEVCGPSTSPCSNLPDPLQEVRPGDAVTFRIEYAIPSGDAENVLIEDWLPLPIFDVGDPDADPGTSIPWTFAGSCPSSGIPAPGSAGCGPTHTVPVSPPNALFPPPSLDAPLTGNGIAFKYGTIWDTNNQAKQIDLLFTIVVTHEPFADGLYLTNETMECEDNTFGTRFCQIAVAQVNVREPELSIRKGAIATNNPYGDLTVNDVSTPLTAGLPVGTPPGVLPTAPPRFTPPINSGNLAGFIGRDLRNVDADDWVTFAIAIENTGGAPAYNIELADIFPLDAVDLPSCFMPNFNSLSVTYGNGTVIPFTLGPGGHGRIPITLGLPLDPSNSTGTNIAIITFEAQLLDKDHLKSGCCENRAQLITYTSVANSHAPNFVDAGFGGPFVDAAKVCVSPRAYFKCIQTTSELHTTPQDAPQGGTADAAIGEIVRFRLVAAIPEGTTLNFQIQDLLPVGLTYIGNPSVVFVTNMGPVEGWPTITGNEITHGDCPGPSFAISSPYVAVEPFVFGAGQDPIFFVQWLTDPTPIYNIYNSDNDPDLELAIIEFNAQVDNIASNQNGTVLTDQFQVRFKDQAGNQFARDSGTVDVRIVEPNLTLTKTANPTTVVQGGTVTYSAGIGNTGTAAAFEVHFADTLPAGLTLVNPAFPVPSGCTNNSSSPGNVNVTCQQLDGLTPKPLITYQVTVPSAVPCITTTLTNIAKVTWTSLPGLQGTPPGPGNPTGQQPLGPSGAATPPNTLVNGERNGSSSYLPFPPGSPNPPNDYFATASATITVICPSTGESKICVTKFSDQNGNGVQDLPLDVGLAGWDIVVTDVSGSPVSGSPFTTVPSYGNICFGVPAPATYTISEVPKPGWIQTAPGMPGTYTVPVVPGGSEDRSFGNQWRGRLTYLPLIVVNYPPPPCVQPPAAMAAWFPLDEISGATAFDIADYPTNGTYSSPNSPTPWLGKVAGARYFGQSYVEVADDPSLNFDKIFSLDTWLWTVDRYGMKRLVDKRAVGTNGVVTGYSLFLYDGILGFHLTNAYGSGTYYSTQFVADGMANGVNWHHVAVTLDRYGSPPVGKFYVDGVHIPAGDFSPLPGLLTNPSPLRLGCSSSSFTDYYRGALDEVELFPRVLTPAEIQGIFLAGSSGKCKCVPPPTAMTHWWAVDEPSGIIAHDMVNPLTYGTHVNGPVPTPAVVAGGLSFDGVNDYVEVAHDQSLDFGTGDLTIDAWIKPDPNNYSGVMTLVDQRINPSPSVWVGYSLYLYNGKLGFHLAQGGDPGPCSPTITSRSCTNYGETYFVANGPWYHIAVTVDRNVSPDGGKFYVDGALIGVFDPTIRQGSLTNPGPLRLGSRSFSPLSGLYRGALDEVELFPRVLTPAEIKGIFLAGSNGKCKATPCATSEMVPVPADKFRMGCDSANNGGYACQPGELPFHSVWLDAYRIDKTEVTNCQYAQCVADGGCTTPANNSSSTHSSYYNNTTYADYPVTWVNWPQADAYCHWAGQRLPTEAEWERAARGISLPTYAYPWGNAAPICAWANFYDFTTGVYCVGDTKPVDSYNPAGASPYGALNMAGNVFEWVNDWYDGSYYSSTESGTNPQGPASGSEKVARGGSWGHDQGVARVAFRGKFAPGHVDYWLGFRCVSSP